MISIPGLAGPLRKGASVAAISGSPTATLEGEPEYVGRLQSRDPDSLREWVSHHYDDVFRFMFHLTRQREAAEDLVQQAFMKALDGLQGYERRSSMRTWLHTIAYREYARWRRKQRLMFPLELLGLRDDSTADRVEQGQVLIEALQQLPPGYREAFLMFEVQQLSIEEISLATGRPVGTVKARLHHARHKLRGLLSDTFKEGLL